MILDYLNQYVELPVSEKKLFNPYVHEDSFATEAYKALPPLKSRLNLQDNGDGTITDPYAGLMWAQADSHAVLKNFSICIMRKFA